MRVRVIVTVLLMTAAPVGAQTRLAQAPKSTLPAHVMCTDLLAAAAPAATLRIAGSHDPLGRLAMNMGDTAVVSRVPDDGLAVGQRYLVRRLPTAGMLYQPTAGGYVPVRTLGWVTVTAMDDVNAMAHVDYACDGIEASDFLEPYAEPVLTAPAAALLPPDFAERVQILPGVDSRQAFADGDMFSIARGSEHGVIAGARYAIYRDRKDGRPLVHIGEAIVVDPSPTSSKLLLMMVTDSVETSDIAVPRR